VYARKDQLERNTALTSVGTNVVTTLQNTRHQLMENWYTRTYTYMYVYVYIHIYIYIYVYVHIYILNPECCR